MKDRIKWIDIAKGLGILLVILGHTFRDDMRLNSGIINYLYYLIYSFHMPLFFMLSGYIFQKNIEKYKKTTEFVKKKINTLLVPWVVFSILIYIIILILNNVPFISGMLNGTTMKIIPIGNYILASIKCENPYAIHLWYLFVLFIIQIVVYLLNKLMVKNKKVFKIILIAICALIYTSISKWDYNIFRYILRNTIYFVFGQIYFENEKIVESKLYIRLALPLSLIILNVYIFCVNLHYNDSYYLCKVLLLMELVFCIPIIICAIVKISKMITHVRALSFLGMNSFVLYILHQPFCCAFVGTVLNKFFPQSLPWYVLIISICCISSVAIPIIVLKLCQIMKMEYILNKLNLKIIK